MNLLANLLSPAPTVTSAAVSSSGLTTASAPGPFAAVLAAVASLDVAALASSPVPIGASNVDNVPILLEPHEVLIADADALLSQIRIQQTADLGNADPNLILQKILDGDATRPVAPPRANVAARVGSIGIDAESILVDVALPQLPTTQVRAAQPTQNQFTVVTDDAFLTEGKESPDGKVVIDSSQSARLEFVSDVVQLQLRVVAAPDAPDAPQAPEVPELAHHLEVEHFDHTVEAAFERPSILSVIGHVPPIFLNLTGDGTPVLPVAAATTEATTTSLTGPHSAVDTIPNSTEDAESVGVPSPVVQTTFHGVAAVETPRLTQGRFQATDNVAATAKQTAENDVVVVPDNSRATPVGDAVLQRATEIPTPAFTAARSFDQTVEQSLAIPEGVVKTQTFDNGKIREDSKATTAEVLETPLGGELPAEDTRAPRVETNRTKSAADQLFQHFRQVISESSPSTATIPEPVVSDPIAEPALPVDMTAEPMTGDSSLFAAVVQATASGAATPNRLPQTPQTLTSQVLTALTFQLATVDQPDLNTITLRLDPPELGEIEVEFRRDETGVNVRVEAKDAVTMEMLVSRGSEIDRLLRQQDFDVSKVEFSRTDESAGLDGQRNSNARDRHQDAWEDEIRRTQDGRRFLPQPSPQPSDQPRRVTGRRIRA